MFNSSLAAQKWRELGEAIDNAPIVVPCTNTDPDLWFPDHGLHNENDSPMRYREAKKLCKVCPVRDLCLEYALIQGEAFGMWGGLTPRERMQIRGRKRGRPQK